MGNVCTNFLISFWTEYLLEHIFSSLGAKFQSLDPSLRKVAFDTFDLPSSGSKPEVVDLVTLSPTCRRITGHLMCSQ